MLLGLYFEPGKDVVECRELLKQVVAKFYIERPKKNEDYLIN